MTVAAADSKKHGSSVTSPPTKRTCSCAPTTHPGSFRCRLHRSLSTLKTDKGPSMSSLLPPIPTKEASSSASSPLPTITNTAAVALLKAHRQPHLLAATKTAVKDHLNRQIQGANAKLNGSRIGKMHNGASMGVEMPAETAPPQGPNGGDSSSCH
ncbi:hypothetical protein AMTRI_Chr06g196450 [Amborella trichopoda]|uniref:Uncharacterized protein n=1 Tax=Amborella trichopoda TaxID=13333 RepID=W1PA67_AMBTC|nr:uncharacterized protein LOC110007346 [Amborella trichopoda]ERN06782.1 hypothetical protein AMTR_s00005p00175820 [Amborella trichopoda]|eukprot:XP_020523458.1 uncharacterized protein LOC110007346 [Amborella trichopoda]